MARTFILCRFTVPCIYFDYNFFNFSFKISYTYLTMNIPSIGSFCSLTIRTMGREFLKLFPFVITGVVD